MLEVVVVKAKNGYFLNFGNETGYHRDSYLVNGQAIERSFKNGWYICMEEPKTVQRVVRHCAKVTMYQILPEYEKLPIDKFPSAIHVDDIPEDFDTISAFYNPIYSEPFEEFFNVEFELKPILEVDLEIGASQFSYPAGVNRYTNHFNSITNSSLKASIEAQLFYPVIVEEHLPCKLSAKDFYNIVRQHIKLNINQSVARITSDYDFCLTVSKDIDYAEPIFNKKEIKTATGRSYKNKKYREFYVKSRSVEVFRAAPEPYQTYPVIGALVANSHAELKAKIDKYLTELMEIINNPLVECPHCKGMGVVEKIVDNQSSI